MWDKSVYFYTCFTYVTGPGKGHVCSRATGGNAGKWNMLAVEVLHAKFAWRHFFKTCIDRKVGGCLSKPLVFDWQGCHQALPREKSSWLQPESSVTVEIHIRSERQGYDCRHPDNSRLISGCGWEIRCFNKRYISPRIRISHIRQHPFFQAHFNFIHYAQGQIWYP